MARIAGIEITGNKNAVVGLGLIYGIGRTLATKILTEANVKTGAKISQLSDVETNKISAIIEKNFKVEGELRQIVFRDIKRLKDNRSFRGMRHKNNLPARGQNTRSNSVTRKGKHAAVGGLKHKLELT